MYSRNILAKPDLLYYGHESEGMQTYREIQQGEKTGKAVNENRNTVLLTC